MIPTLNASSARFIIVILFVAHTGLAQTPSFKWAGRIAGVNSSTPSNLATDIAGNVITVGYMSLPATSDFDPGPGVYYIPVTGSQNNYISKLDAYGNFVWAKAIGGPGINDIHGITTDSVGNIYLTGNFSNTADFDPGPGVLSISSNGSGTDIFVAKLDSNANLVWVKTVGGTGADGGSSVAVDKDGNVYTTGMFHGTADLDPGPGSYSLFAYNYDAFVLKLDANGDFIWAKNMGGNQDDQGNDIVADDSSNIYVTGQFSGFGIFGNYALGSLGPSDVFITKLDAAGDVVWVKQLGENTNATKVYSLAYDDAGSVIVAGQYFNSMDINPNAGVSIITPMAYGCGNYFLLKLTSGAGFLWGTSYARPPITCQANIGIATDTAGNIYATGTFGSSSDFDPGTGSYILHPAETFAGIIGHDIFVSRVNANGTFGWARSMGSIRGDRGIAVDVDPSGAIYTTGIFADTVDMNPGVNNYLLSVPDSSAGNPDYGIYVHKLEQCDNIDTVLTELACNLYTLNGQTYTSSGTYKQMFATAGGCDSTVTLILQIYGLNTSVSVNTGSILSLETGATYQWLDCSNNMSAIPGATNALFNPSSDGYYAVAISKNGCLDTSACRAVNLVGVTSLTANTILKYYPNPVQDHLTIELDRTYKQVTLTLYNIAGQRVQTDEFRDSKIITSSLHVSPGMYMMSVQADGMERQWLRLVK